MAQGVRWLTLLPRLAWGSPKDVHIERRSNGTTAKAGYRRTVLDQRAIRDARWQHAAMRTNQGGGLTLLRLTPEHNPDAPATVDWGASNDPKVRQIQEQSQKKPLPVYVRQSPNKWEYLGRFRVARIATDKATLTKREAKAGHVVSYAIYLEKN